MMSMTATSHDDNDNDDNENKNEFQCIALVDVTRAIISVVFFFFVGWMKGEKKNHTQNKPKLFGPKGDLMVGWEWTTVL